MGKNNIKKIIVTGIIFIFILSFLLVNSFSNLEVFSKLKGAVSGNTVYRNWSSLTSVDNSYSYSTLVYTNKTGIYANYNYSGNEDTNKYARYQTTILNNNKPTPIFRMNSTTDSASIVITNCWYDEDGNLGHAVITATPTDLWTSNSRVTFGLRRYEKTVGTQSVPTWDENGTVVDTRAVKINEPLEFYLGSYRATASVTLTYYKTLSFLGNGSITTRYSTNDLDSKSVSKVTYSGTKATDISKVNSFYYDIDIAYTDESVSSKVFNGKEGVYPTSGVTNAYYATSGSGNLTAGSKTVNFRLSQNSNGLYIGTNSVYTEYSSGTYWMKYAVSGIWHATSTAFYTSGLSGTYTFNYSGADCNIGFIFFSPLAYTINPPKNSAPSTVYTGENWNYKISQYIPNIYLNSDVDFGSVYSNLNNAGYITSYGISDPIDSRVTYRGNATFKDSDDNSLTDYMGIHNGGGIVGTHTNGTSFTNYMSSADAYNNIYTLTIPVTVSTPTSTAYNVTNTARATSKIGSGTSKNQNSNTVTTTVKSPKVVYNCTANGGTGNTTVYHNVEDDIDLTKTCTHSTETFLGWATTSTITSPSQLISSKKIPTAAQIHNNTALETTTLYGIYTIPITVSATAQSKVYDGTSLDASESGNAKCTVTSGTLNSAHTLTCTSSGTITHAGTNTKTLGTVTIKDSGNNNVNSLYHITTANSTLTVTKRNTICTSASDSKTYDGTPLTAAGGTCDNLATGHTASFVNLGSVTHYTGTTTGNNTVNNIRIKDSSDVIVGAYGEVPTFEDYNITVVNGTLGITKRNTICTSASDSKTYDGTPLTAAGGTCDNLAPGDDATFTNTGSVINYSVSMSHNNTISKIIISNSNNQTVGNFNDTSTFDDYNITTANGNLVINKRNLIVTTSNQSKTYDGTPLEATHDCIGAGLAPGDSITCHNSGSITQVGTTPKEISVTSLKNSLDENVSINYITLIYNGTLEITNPGDATCPSILGYQGVYDGDKHSITATGASGGTVMFRLGDSGNYRAEEYEFVDAGTNRIYVMVEGDATHQSITCGYADVVITPKPITVTTSNQSKTYDGTALNATNDCVVAGLISTDSLSCSNIGVQTNPGQSVKSIDSVDIRDKDNRDIQNNYSVTKTNGTLTVYGEIEPEITKEVTSLKPYYRTGDTITYTIKVKNTSSIAITNIKVTENTNKARFIAYAGYSLLDNKTAIIDSIPAGGEATLYSTYTVLSTDSDKIVNEVEIKEASATEYYRLKEKTYKATATANLQSIITVCKSISGVALPNTFQVRITGEGNTFETYVTIKKDECKKVYVNPGSYRIREILPQEYRIVSVTGGISSNNSVLNVVQGNNYSVTFTNAFIQKAFMHSFGRIENKIEGGE